MNSDSKLPMQGKTATTVATVFFTKLTAHSIFLDCIQKIRSKIQFILRMNKLYPVTLSLFPSKHFKYKYFI